MPVQKKFCAGLCKRVKMYVSGFWGICHSFVSFQTSFVSLEILQSDKSAVSLPLKNINLNK